MLPEMGVTFLSFVSELDSDLPPSGSSVSHTSSTSHTCAMGTGGAIKGKCCDTSKYSNILMSLIPSEMSSKRVINPDIVSKERGGSTESDAPSTEIVS